MARPLRLEVPGGIYHVTARGNERRPVFRDRQDRLRFLETLAQVVARFGWLCLAYCQMGNHYHLLLETPQPNLARGMRQLNGVYAQRFNRGHGRSGHLFQARYHSTLVQKDAHLRVAAAYVVTNPVRAGLCERAGDWRWSSFRACAGLEAPPSFLALDALLGCFGNTRAAARAAYRELVEADSWTPPASSPFFGDPRFIGAHSSELVALPEVPRYHWQPLRPPLEELFARDRTHGIALAYREYGYTMQQIAKHLGVHYATVSRRLRRLERDLVSECKT